MYRTLMLMICLLLTLSGLSFATHDKALLYGGPARAGSSLTADCMPPRGWSAMTATVQSLRPGKRP